MATAGILHVHNQPSMRSFILFGFAFIATACSSSGPSPAPTGRKDPLIPFTVVRSYPHDTTAYTEGLLVHDGVLYESTGSPANLPQTRSLFGAVDTATGRIDVKAELDRDKHFGEGIAFLGGKVYQVTYQSRAAFVYDAATFKLLREVKLPTPDGWGLTTDGVHLVLSNGTSKIYFIDPATMKTVKTLIVRGRKGRTANLNELELVKGDLYAVVWQTNHMVRIDTATGAITGRVDLTSLVRDARKKYRGAKELNGMAYDAASGRVYITGKMWPHIYEIRLEQ